VKRPLLHEHEQSAVAHHLKLTVNCVQQMKEENQQMYTLLKKIEQQLNGPEPQKQQQPPGAQESSRRQAHPNSLYSNVFQELTRGW